MNVIYTTYDCHVVSLPPSILSSTVFCENGNISLRMNHPTKRRKMARGNMNIIHSPKPIPIFRPSASLRAFKAIALGGVPIGVPIPPMLAPIGIASARPIRPLPLAGNCLSTGVRNVSIIAAVAVLERNIEKTPVTSRKPRSTFSDFVPKGLSMIRAIVTSSPTFVAAIARMNPPINSMMIGSAKQPMIFL